MITGNKTLGLYFDQRGEKGKDMFNGLQRGGEVAHKNTRGGGGGGGGG